MRSWPGLPRMSSLPLDSANLGAQDAVVVVTDHSRVDYDLVAKHAPLVIDTRGVYRGKLSNLVKA
jgi:UDP-N-acetyl-D-glucosamine dehydrogenase